MHDKQNTEPDNTAVRVALWRALHVQVDSAPHVLEDEVGLQLASPSTSSLALASTHFLSAGRRSPLRCGSLRLTSPERRIGRDNA